jgi:hypothetical protein
MPTVDKPHNQIEWVPLAFILAACYIVTLLVLVKQVDVSVLQIGGGIATTFGGAAAGAYGTKMMQARNSATRSTDPDPPTPPANPA